MFHSKKYATILALTLISASAFAADSGEKEKVLRWTGSVDQDGSIAHVIDVLNQRNHSALTTQDFLLQEERDLAFNHYQRFVQRVEGIPLHGKSIRIWTEIGSTKAIQVEAKLDTPKTLNQLMMGLKALGTTASELRKSLTSQETVALARQSVLSDSEDANIRGIDWNDEWRSGELMRVVKVRGKRGVHQVVISLEDGDVSSRSYQEFPQADMPTSQADITIPAQVYPIYEETGEDRTTLLPRVAVELRHILPQVPRVDGDIYAPLKTRHYYDSNMDPVLGATEAGQAKGFWSMTQVKENAAKLRAGLPMVDNSYANGLLLMGRYATINLHPDAITKYAPLNFKPQFSSPLYPNWMDVTVDGKDMGEMTPATAYAGKPLTSAQEAWDRPARRLPDHNPAAYVNDGFDEIQVYYAIDTLFAELQARGFKDPELSTRPFNAFLFNPDISMRDNAFYTDDTINFTTYSPKAQNFARDNSTIWHELGHGVMDRLMGDNIELADTGGLSEGMADFVAAMVIQAVTQGKPFAGSTEFRIINKTGFFLTNEVHDDGESYGGTMKDFMDAVIVANPQTGLEQVVDVVLEAMRLTRDYPGLTAADWFSHILFADSLGRPGLRQPGELKNYLLTSLAGRNFKMDGGQVATFSIVNTATNLDVLPGTPGSRNSPVKVKIAQDGTAKFELKASLKGSDSYSFQYPVQLRLKFNGGPLEGAVHWTGEEKGDQVFTLNSEADSVTLPLEVSGKCDEVNREDGSCVDYAYIQIWNNGETHRPTAKKRFYVRVMN
jgi:hypothetical protein